MNRETFARLLEAPPVREVATEAGVFLFRVPTAGDRDRLDAFISASGGDYSGVRGFMLAAVLVSHDGEALGTAEEMRGLPVSVAEALFQPIAEAYGIGGDDVGNDLGRSANSCSSSRSGSE